MLQFPLISADIILKVIPKTITVFFSDICPPHFQVCTLGDPGVIPMTSS